MLKISGKNRECLIVLNIPQLREKINKNLRESPCFLREWRSSDRVWLSQRTCLSLHGGSRETGLPSPSSLARCHCPGCGSQRLLRCRLHPAGRCPNSSSLFPPLAAVVAVASQREEAFCAFLLKNFLKNTFYWTFILLYSCQNKRRQEGKRNEDVDCGMWAVMWRCIRGRARSCSRQTPCERRWRAGCRLMHSRNTGKHRMGVRKC